MHEYIFVMLGTAVISGITTYIVGKRLLRETKTDLKQQILDVTPDLIDFLLGEVEHYIASPEGAKVIYSIGGLIGNGAKQGLGLTSGRGKFKFEDILAQIAGGFIQRYVPAMGRAASTGSKSENRNTNKKGLNIV